MIVSVKDWENGGKGGVGLSQKMAIFDEGGRGSLAFGSWTFEVEPEMSKNPALPDPEPNKRIPNVRKWTQNVQKGTPNVRNCTPNVQKWTQTAQKCTPKPQTSQKKPRTSKEPWTSKKPWTSGKKTFKRPKKPSNVQRTLNVQKTLNVRGKNLQTSDKTSNLWQRNLECPKKKNILKWTDLWVLVSSTEFKTFCRIKYKGLHIRRRRLPLLWLVAAADALIIKPIRVTLCKNICWKQNKLRKQ